MRSMPLMALSAALLLSAVSVSAQEGGAEYMPTPMPVDVHRGPAGIDVTVRGIAGGPASAVPNFLGQVFPPELVMRHQADIGLSSGQREAITEAMSESYAQVVEAQWSIQAATEQLKSLLEGTQVDEISRAPTCPRLAKTCSGQRSAPSNARQPTWLHST